ncbi:hypothetical protein TVAG_121000 [Trichomonas vaginalis G3]|uniref:Uncharacterized protein n=1 Tax=Trichomonas vaginalis (strain ATCC PRA-98 / G3) TaxID=412133 RepID=A2D7P5_TRIV3|nr:hypothetical protein TVAGG3_0994380 [Trichomonas vaginalis G3]EAY23762.1 hypothetical protein TVAG_121000 [Trichomonas vaginalis G3]KAI5490274.1 hypothetical protein TVAGG3_0994380 [Trichomonas vaginalis G3]|eukprot:XP_001277010.1 hypothetical protein [Trichomonas vaginalis G3]
MGYKIIPSRNIQSRGIYSFYSFSTNITSLSFGRNYTVHAATNDGKIEKLIFTPNQTIALKSVNLLIFDPSDDYFQLSKIIFDEPEKVKPFSGNYSKFSKYVLTPILPSPTPIRTPEQTPSQEKIVTPQMTDKDNKHDDDNDNNDEGDDQKSKSGKLSSGAIAGIIIGVLIIAAVCIAAIFIIKKRQALEEKSTEDQAQFMNMI